VSPIAAVQAASTMPHATVQSLDGYGHLVHEEAPEPVARRLLSAI
jgi:magnesium chelatase accessory protein